MNKKTFALFSSAAVVTSFVATPVAPLANELPSNTVKSSSTDSMTPANEGRNVKVAQQESSAVQAPPFFQYQGQNFKVNQIAQYDSGAGEGGTEILAYDQGTKRAFVTNGAKNGMDILSFENLESGKFTVVKSSKHIKLEDFGIEKVADITSVASHPTLDLVALSVVSDPKTDPGYVVLLTKDGEFISKVQVGALPDMVAFTPDGKKLLSANEGEPSDDYSVDPEGTISIIDVTGDLKKVTAQTLTFKDVKLDENVRVSSKGTTLQQLEPEYITVSSDSKRAYVSLQENNAIATINLENNTIIDVKGLGIKDHSVAGNELDGKRDKKTNIEKLPLLGFYMPDAIDTFTVGEKSYILTPNEGDARDYEAYSEESSIGDIADQIQLKAENYKGYTQKELDQLVADGLLDELEKTNITLENGKNAEGKYEALYSYGGRSFSIFDGDTMELVFDSGSEFEKITADALPDYFNTSNDEISYDKRSSSKGPEPETVVTGEIEGVNYAFIALERTSGIMVYDLTNPESPEFVTLISSRDFSEDVKGDVSPEGLQFIPADVSPTGYPLLAATHEVSGTVAVYEFGGKEIKNEKPFVFGDVAKTHWAYGYINNLYQKNIVSGVTSTEFAPERNISRVEFAAILGRALDLQASEGSHPFTDVPKWVDKEVKALYEAGIIKGIGNQLFDSESEISREEMAMMIARAYEYVTKTNIQVVDGNIYNDHNLIGRSAQESVQKLYQTGIMVGGTNNQFAPKNPANRAQAVKVISELLDKSNSK